MNSQNTICAIFGLTVPVVALRARIHGRLLPGGGGAFAGLIVPITQGTLVRALYDPVGVIRR